MSINHAEQFPKSEAIATFTIKCPITLVRVNEKYFNLTLSINVGNYFRPIMTGSARTPNIKVERSSNACSKKRLTARCILENPGCSKEPSLPYARTPMLLNLVS